MTIAAIAAPAAAQANVVGTHVVTPQTVTPHVVTSTPPAASAAEPASSPVPDPTPSPSPAPAPAPAPAPGEVDPAPSPSSPSSTPIKPHLTTTSEPAEKTQGRRLATTIDELNKFEASLRRIFYEYHYVAKIDIPDAVSGGNGQTPEGPYPAEPIPDSVSGGNNLNPPGSDPSDAEPALDGVFEIIGAINQALCPLGGYQRSNSSVNDTHGAATGCF